MRYWSPALRIEFSQNFDLCSLDFCRNALFVSLTHRHAFKENSRYPLYLDIVDSQDWSVIRLFELGPPVPVNCARRGQRCCLALRRVRFTPAPKYPVCPSRDAALLRGVVVFWEEVVLVGRRELDVPFVEALEHVPFVPLNRKLKQVKPRFTTTSRAKTSIFN